MRQPYGPKDAGIPSGTLPGNGRVRILLIVNATASSVTARRRVVIQKALGSDHDLTVAETTRRGHATRLARGAAHDGVDVVVVLAGDGTLNEAANGLAGSQTALAPLPGGSTNVFARSIGVALDPIDATSELLESLDQRSFRRIGLGSVEGRRFVFHCGIGFDAAVIHEVERGGSALKRYLAHPLYVFATVDTHLRRYERPPFRVELPDGEVVGPSTFAIVSNQQPWSYLGTRPLYVNTAVDLDNELSLTLLLSIAPTVLLRLAASAVGRGRKFDRHRKVVQRNHLEALTIVAERPVPYQVDGDYLGEAERLEITFEPDALTLVVPTEEGPRRAFAGPERRDAAKAQVRPLAWPPGRP
jgi:diacylglycerol kinase family enzyme